MTNGTSLLHKLLPNPAHRRWAIAGLVIAGLFLIELVALLYGKPSALQGLPWLTSFVAFMAEWVPPVQRFGRCAAANDAGTGLMLALSTVFLPLKLVAVYYAVPARKIDPKITWKELYGGTTAQAAWTTFYAFMLAVVCLVPTWAVYGPVFSAVVDPDLRITRSSQTALCSGGMRAFWAWARYSGVCVISASLSMLFFTSFPRFLLTRHAR